MIKNIKKSIFIGVSVFAIFGVFGVADATMRTSNYPIDTSYNSYYQNNYDQGYSNTSSNTVYGYNNNSNSNSNTGYIPTDYNTNNNQSSQPQNVYGSDPLVPKPATVLASSSGSTNNTTNTNTIKTASTTKTVSNNSTNTKNTNTVKSEENAVNNGQAVSANTISGSDLDNKNSIVALSAYGTDRFLPDTIFEWIIVFALMLIIIILFRLITKKKHYVEVQA